MALKEYRKKRSFGETPEPKPSPAAGKGGERHFVVQKHQASHLHYDLRLEHAGVLKSWAVPKGPSMDPRDKRLAIMVEDHPLAYKDFKGRIPEGQYGAGLVEIWDKGTYTLTEPGPGQEGRSMDASLAKGHIDFTLKGKRLKGAFTLVRLKPRGDGKNNQWLLMKRSGPPPMPPARPHAAPAAASDPPRPKKARTPALDDRDLEGSAKKPFPTSVSPMLATLVDGPFDREGWAFEIKWDGFRSIAEIRGGKVRLLSRNGKAQNARFPTVAVALDGFPVDAVFDGEIVAVDAKGRPHFQDLQNAMRPGKGRILYYVFDVLYAGGHDLRGLPLKRRRVILEKLLPVSETVRLSEAIPTSGKAFFRAAEKNDLEGVMAKDLNSPYRSGARTREWLKVKVQKGQEAVICGFTRPRASRKHFGALILGAFRKGKLTYIGHVGTGFTERALKDIRAKLDPLATPRSPFAEEPPSSMPVTWVEPRLICEVKFTEWTAEGLMRHPVFLGLREDKSAREVVPEEPEPREAVLQKTKFRTRAELTHLEKVFWPGEGITKGDLVAYYWQVSEWILPYLKARPQALNRHPDGITGGSFFQKNLAQTPPDWVKTIDLPTESKRKTIRYLVCENRDTLLYEANLGSIEINVWSSSIPHVDSPDYIVLDFDPLETSFPSVVEAVLATKVLLDEMAIPAFCKTSGATGLHIYIPLAPRFSYEQARELAHLVCLVVNRRNPGLTSLERSPAKRKGRVYLDYLQNRAGATMAAPYAVRPREGAPVSMPLDWKDVTAKLDPLEFNIRTVPKLLAKKGDAWRGLFKKRLDLAAALAGFERWQKSRKSR
jgi:bifunctional non-homologous end joining protein LigD